MLLVVSLQMLLPLNTLELTKGNSNQWLLLESSPQHTLKNYFLWIFKR